MPRPQNKIKLTMDDLRKFLNGENGEVLQKMKDWARGELERRENAGREGGRPKKATPEVIQTAKKIDQEGVKLAQQHDDSAEWIDIGEIWDEMAGEMIQAQRHVRRGTIRKRPDIA